MGRTTMRWLALVGTVGAVFAFGPTRGLTPSDHAPVDVRDARARPVAGGAQSDAVPGTLVVDLLDGSGDADLVAIERVLGHDLDWVHELAHDEALVSGPVPDLAAALRALHGHHLVEVVEPEIMLEAYGRPNDPMLDKQWNLVDIGMDEVWATGATGRGVVVAVVDTGVTKVQDLEGTHLLQGASFVPGASTSADDQGHGTHVAGTIAQTTNNGVGVAGVAPAATILPVKVLSGAGFGSSAWIAAGIDYAVDEGADVINLSLGGGYSSIIHNAIKKARDHGVIVVAAAGNSGRSGVGYPGALEETIGVAATGPSGERAPYSSWGKGVDIAAPGGDTRKTGGGILQDTIDGKGGHTYAELQGTSMATPHVAGAAAVLLGTGMAPDAVERTLLETARGEGWDEKLGHGRLDLAAAMGARSGLGMGKFRFLLGAVLALLVAQLASTRASYQLASATVSATVAGGLFFVPAWLLGAAGFLSSPALEWPAAFIGFGFVTFPLWLSALMPSAVGFTLGAFRGTRPIAAGLATGSGAYLLHAAATGAVAPSWLPGSVGTAWLAVNGILCLLVALGLAGAQKLDEQELR